MKTPKLILSIILMLMIAYDLTLHFDDVVGIGYGIFDPGQFFTEGAFYWGSIAYNIFWMTYWGIAAIISIVLVILLIKEKKHGKI